MFQLKVWWASSSRLSPSSRLSLLQTMLGETLPVFPSVLCVVETILISIDPASTVLFAYALPQSNPCVNAEAIQNLAGRNFNKRVAYLYSCFDNDLLCFGLAFSTIQLVRTREGPER